jgi:aminomethyltransferase
MPGRFRVVEGRYRNDWHIAAGTGYTGERGAEIAVPAANGRDLMQDLVAAGAVPCALGARDTLRLEMGYPLWGQDLDEETTPFEAGLGWVVDWNHDFVGRSALLAQEEAVPRRSLVAIATEGRAVPRHGSRVRSGASAGTVTSGNFSPTLGHGIALAYLTPPIEPGADTDTEVEIRGTWQPARITPLPFVSR